MKKTLKIVASVGLVLGLVVVGFYVWAGMRVRDLRERTINPYALLPENGVWYVVGDDLEDGRRKKFRVSRIRGEIRFATRRERDFRVPEDFSIEEHLGYVWEADTETFGSLRLEDLEDRILAELERG